MAKKPAGKKSATAKKAVGKKAAAKMPAAKPPAKKGSPTKVAAKKTLPSKSPGQRRTRGGAAPHCEDFLILVDGQLRVRLVKPDFRAEWYANHPADSTPSIEDYIVLVNKIRRGSGTQAPFDLTLCIQVLAQDQPLGTEPDLEAVVGKLCEFLTRRAHATIGICTC